MHSLYYLTGMAAVAAAISSAWAWVVSPRYKEEPRYEEQAGRDGAACVVLAFIASVFACIALL